MIRKELILKVPHDVWENVLDRAGKCGMEPEKFIETFLIDLSGYTEEDLYKENERKSAQNWFEYYFEKNVEQYSPYLYKLIQSREIDNFIDNYEDMVIRQKAIEKAEKSLKQGFEISREGKIITWKDITGPFGHQRYANIHEWEESTKESMEMDREQIEEDIECMKSCFDKNTIEDADLEKIYKFCDKYLEIKRN